MTNQSRCRAKDPATCRTHGVPKVAGVRGAADLLAELGDRRAQATAARVEARRGRKQMLADLLADVNAGRVFEVGGRTFVGRPLPLAAANVDRLTYELQKSAEVGVAVWGVDRPVDAVDAAWQELVDTYDVSFKDEALVVRDNEAVLRNTLLERVHAAAY